MEITREQTGNLTATVHVHIDPADYKPQVDAELKKQAKKANIPGFRPGKVPVGVIRRMVGKGLVIETVQRVVAEGLSNYLKEEKLNVLGQPLPDAPKSEDDFAADASIPMDFAFRIGLPPEITLNYEQTEAPAKQEIEIDDEYLQKELDLFRERFGGVTQPDEVAEGDIFYGRLFEVDEAGEAVEDGFEQMVPFNPMRIESEAFFSAYVGAKVDDIMPVDLSLIHEDPIEVAKLLFIDEEKIEDLMKTSLKLEVKRINRLGKSEMNEEFFARMDEEYGWSEAEAAPDDADLEVEDVEIVSPLSDEALLDDDETEDAEAGESESTEAEEESEEEAPEDKPAYLVDEAAFLEKFREQLASSVNENTRWEYRTELRKQILASHPMELPDEFLKEWLQHQDEKNPKTPEQVEEEYPSYSETQAWSLIIDQIAEENSDIKVTEADLQAQMLLDLRRMLGQSGQMLSPDQEAQYLQMMSENQELVQQSFSQVLISRVFDHLEEKIAPKEITYVSATEYFAKQEKEREEEAARLAVEVEEKAEEAAPEEEAAADTES